MKTGLIVLATCILVVLAPLNGRAQTNAATLFVGSSPTNLARLVASADRIVITNRFGPVEPRYRGVSFSISRSGVSKIVAAVSSAERLPGMSDSLWDLQMQFFSGGTNRLAVVNFQGRNFLAEKGEYVDKSGVLEKLYKDILDQTPPEDR